MKMESLTIALLAIGILGIIAATPTHAALAGLSVYARTDKASYSPGDSGTLFITIRNQGTNAFTIKNITVNYPWKSFVIDHWVGNTTTVLSPVAALAAGQTYNTQYSFAVPSDGTLSSGISSVFGGSISISVGTAEPSPDGTYSPGGATILYTIGTYQPLSLASSLLPILEIALLGIAVVMLALVYMGISKLSKK